MKKNHHIIPLKSQGFCFGVKNSVSLLYNALENSDFPKPFYLLGDLVHNKYVSEFFKAKGVTILKGESKLSLIDNINAGTIVITAHGASDEIKNKILEKGLYLLDTTCPIVKKSINNLIDYAKEGYTILYYGKNKHPETEYALSCSQKVHLIENSNDIANTIHSEKLILMCQTTMSEPKITEMASNIKMIYPKIINKATSCHATKVRQEQLLHILKTYYGNPNTCFLAVGDKMSNNTQKLLETAKEEGNLTSYLIETANDLNFNELKKYHNIIIASGTSTPLAIVNEIVEILNHLDTYKNDSIKSALKGEDYI